MTLQAYSPEKMEKLALRLLDISTQLRGVAKDLRMNQLEELRINDKKALLWCENLEIWAQKNRNNLDLVLGTARMTVQNDYPPASRSNSCQTNMPHTSD